MKKSLLYMLCIALIVAAPAFAAGKTAKITTPTINCGGSSLLTNSTTEASLTLTVCAPAGGTGLPAGFTIQWETAADYALYGWTGAPSYCDASFSGNAAGFLFNVPAGSCSTVTIGEELTAAGASTSCPGALACGTDYVFRAFGHATNTLNRSDFTSAVDCRTAECTHNPGCTYTQGYWKTHSIDPTGLNADQWPADVQANGLQLGNVTYTEAELEQIMNTPVAGNGLVSLAHQLIAAKLNVANGADPSAASAAIASADAMIGSLVVPPIGSGFLSNTSVSSLVQTLTAYNEGGIGPGHCN